MDLLKKFIFLIKEMKLNLYSENFIFQNRLKNFVKTFFGVQNRGPQSVLNSLVRGLNVCNIDYALNQNPVPSSAITACVINGPQTLLWALKQKRQGKIKRIIAGPNISMPEDFNRLILNPEIDVFIVPCKWAENFCASFDPNIRSRIKIWAAGVETLPENVVLKEPSGKVLIYQKNAPDVLLSNIKKELEKKSIPSVTLVYNKHSREEYLNKLKEVDFAIFLSQSESQGLALHEAWMMNVPTLIWNGGHMRFGHYEWLESSAAPYLDEQAGMFFPSQQLFSSSLDIFLQKLSQFTPRDYHLANFTDEITTKNYLKILNSI